MDKDLLQETNQLLKQLLKKKSLPYSFFSGLAHSLGATLGFTLIITFLTYLVNRLSLFPLFGRWLSNFLDQSIIHP